MHQLGGSLSNFAKERNADKAVKPQLNFVFFSTFLSIVLKADILLMLQTCFVHLNVFNRKFFPTAMN